MTLPEEGEAANLEIVSGDEQLGPAGALLARQIVVRVTDSRDRPVPSHEVVFVVESGGGSVAPATIQTDGTGGAAAGWTLGPGAGSQSLRARTARGGSSTMLEVTFSATAVAGSGSLLVGVGGDEQTGPVNSALADSLKVKATDALGNPVANVEVTWTASGGGSIGPATVVTGADGLAAAERVLGPTAGAQSAQASVDGFTGSPVTFSHTAVPANTTRLVKVSGDGQTAPGGFEVAGDLVVRLEDENGNGIGSRPITWVVPTGNGSVNPVNSMTNPNGLATTRWTLPSAAGSYTVSAVFSGFPPVPFSATATADVPTTIELVSGNNQSAPVGSAVANPLVVRVTDANDNPVPNVSVAWTAVGGGSVSDATTPTSSSGLAQVTRTLGLVPGQYTTTAAVDGLSGSPITFTSTATVGPPAKLAIVTQPGSPTTSGSAFSPVPVIEVQDAQGNAVGQGGIEVTASITSGQAGASLTNDQRNTNSSGRAVFTNLRITGPPATDYVLTFTAAFGGSPLTSVSSTPLTVTAGGAARIVILQQPSSTVQSGSDFPVQPEVQVVDATGNPVAGNRTIQVEIGNGAGTLSGTLTASTGGGSTATFTNLRITGTTGARTLIFSSGALTPAESNPINVTAGPATSMAIQAGGSTQTAGVGQNVPTPPAVILTDASGNPVAGVNVDFDVTAGNGSVNPGTVATGTNGIAAVNRWTLGPVEGPNTLVASVPSAPALGTETFNATGTAAPNQAPTAQDDDKPAYTVDEDGTLSITAVADRVLFNDTDPEGDALTAVNASDPAGGAVVLSANGSFDYTPDPDFNGTDTFTYQANDGLVNSNTATVTITVTPVNDPPSFQAGSDQVVSALSGAVTVPGWATGIAPGPANEGQTVSFQVSTDNDLVFTALPEVDPSGTLTYTPALVTLVPVVVTVTALDSGGATSDPQTFTITINP